MSSKVVKETIEKALRDEAFAQKLFSNPDEALADVADKLTDEEKASLKALTPDTLKGFSAVLKDEGEKPPGKWYTPGSFKEFGGAVLSLSLVILMFYAVFEVYGMVAVAPTTYTVGDNEMVVDTYLRSKDLFLLLFPLFSAVVTFWLGVAIEGRRADANQDAADTAREAQQQAEESETAVRTEAAGALGKVEGHLSAMSLSATPAADGPLEPLGAAGGEETAAARAASIDDLLATVRQAQADIRR